jgi:hypothetical protein
MFLVTLIGGLLLVLNAQWFNGAHLIGVILLILTALQIAAAFFVTGGFIAEVRKGLWK